jgi:hypothetical protein
MNTKISNEDIGIAGERLVAMVYKKLGHKVIISSDKYDSKKDMTIDGIMTEVKTQTLYRMFQTPAGTKQAFTVDIINDKGKIYSNQLSKCTNAEKLVFVQRSSSNDRVVRIYEAPRLGNRYYVINQNKKDKRYVAGFLTCDMNLIEKITDEIIVDVFMDNWKGM